MGKQGPCYHCGVTSTPLWRNGPPNKPTLCNACGSRWRTKGTLINYTPLHSRAEFGEFEDFRVSNVKTVSINNKEAKILKRKFDNGRAEHGVVPPHYNQGFSKWFDEDTSNRSSSGSVISNDESCAQYGSVDASDLTGPSQPIAWDTTMPSKKRTCVNRPKPSPVEKLTKDLYTIWHEQHSSCLSEGDLLFETGKSMVSVEIGHGSVLIRHPSSIDREEESEVSSLTIDHNQQTLVSVDKSSPGLFKCMGVNLSSRVNEKLVKPANQVTETEKIRSDFQLGKLQILANHTSPLCRIDLQDLKYKNGIVEEEVMGGFNTIATGHSASMTISNRQHQKYAGGKVKIQSPGRSLNDSSYDEKEPFNQDGTIFRTKSLFSSLNDNDSSRYSEESSDQDLLLHVLSNTSFPQAELMPTNFGCQP